MIDGVPTWRTKFDEDLLQLADSSTDSPTVYAKAWANYVNNRVDATTGQAQDRLGAEITGTIILGPRLTFNKATFQAKLLSLFHTNSPSVGANQVAEAWEAAWLASTLIYLPGDSVGAPSPVTTWSIVTSLIIPASISLSKVFLISNLPLQLDVSTRRDSQWPLILEKAVHVMQGSASGLNSVPPPGPNPLLFSGPLA